MTFAIGTFFVSLGGIGVLFALKYWEMRRGAAFLPTVRARADVQAAKLKDLASAAWLDLAKIPPMTLRAVRVIIHEAALGMAALARTSERQAHRLADFVSHKRGFERRETRSEFLRKVGEHRQANGLDTDTNNGQNS